MLIDIGDKVLIIDAEIKATVDAVLRTVNGIEYRIVYWDDCERKIVWVHPNEITKLTKEK